jgi:hypothetical protein
MTTTIKVMDLTPNRNLRENSAYFDPEALSVFAFCDTGNSTPMLAYNGRQCYLGRIPSEAVGDEYARSYVATIEPLLLEVAEGYDQIIDPRGNLKGKLSEAAQAVLERLQGVWDQEFAEHCPTYWKAAEWFSPATRETTEDILQSESLQAWAVAAVGVADVEGAALELSDVLREGEDLLSRFLEGEDDEEGDQMARARVLLEAYRG